MRLRNVLAATLIFFSAALASAQTFTLTGRFLDESTGAPVEYVTVSVTKQNSTNVISYDQTNAKGEITLKKVPAGTFVLKADLLGYETLTKEIKVEKDMKLEDIKIKPSTTYLEAATISDVGNLIVVKKDTVEYNASLFKTMDNDMLEDLLKKLPGVEVSSDGTITANGKDISKIKVDGKTFFLDDPQLASKNLPAKIIDKVKVIEEKSEQAKFTGIDDGEEETILDLSIQKGMMDGWLGNLMAGGGVDLQNVPEGKSFSDVNAARFQGSAMVARFGDNLSVAILGNVNNTNNRGFNDLAGGMMGGMRGGGGGMGMGGMGGGFGGFGGNGISTSYMGGGNVTLSFGSDSKSEFSGNYLYNGNEKYVEEVSSKQTRMKEGYTLLNDQSGNDYTNTYGHRAGIRLDWKISDASSIMFTPQFNIGYGNFLEQSNTSTRNKAENGDITNVNSGLSKNNGKNNSLSTSGELLWRQRLGKAGRTLSLSVNYSYSDNKIDGLNYSLTNYYNGDDYTTNIIDQNYLQKQNSYRIGGRFSYTEPLGNKFFLELTYRINYTKSDSRKDTYDKDEQGKYTILDEQYSNHIDNVNINHNGGFNIQKQGDKYRLTIGAGIQPTKQINNTTQNGKTTNYTNSVINWAPTARFDYDFNDNSSLRLRYNGRSTQPSITQLQPVEDNTNPLNISRGNPNLTPSFSHSLNTDFHNNNRETFSSVNGSLGLNYNMNNIVNASWVDKGGVTYRVPINNKKGAFSANARVMFNTPISKSKFSVMNNASINYANSMSFVGKEGIDGTNPESYLDLKNYDENNYNTLSFMEMLRFTYRGDHLEVSLGGNTRFSKSWYQITTTNVGATWTTSINGNINWNFAEIFSAATDARYTFYNGYTSGYNDPTFVWNAEVSAQILKRMATISLKCYDILGQSKNTYRTIADNYIQDVSNNTLGRYIMLSFTFRFGSFGNMRSGNRGGRGPGMGGGHMGPPMMMGGGGFHR